MSDEARFPVWAAVLLAVAAFAGLGVWFNRSEPSDAPPPQPPAAPVAGNVLEASAAGDVERVQALLANGAEVNLTDARGRTPLHVATSSGMARTLIEAGADLDALDGDQVSAVVAALHAPYAEGSLRQLIRTTRNAEFASEFPGSKDLGDPSCEPGCRTQDELFSVLGIPGSAEQANEIIPGFNRIWDDSAYPRRRIGSTIECCAYVDRDAGDASALFSKIVATKFGAADGAERERLALVLARDVFGPAVGALPEGCDPKLKVETPSLRTSEQGSVELKYLTAGYGFGKVPIRRVVVVVPKEGSPSASARETVGECTVAAENPGVTVTLTASEPQGGLTKEQIASEVGTALSLSRCWPPGASPVDPSGETITVRFSVAPNGLTSVSEARAAPKSNPPVEKCVASAFRSLWIPLPRHGAVRGSVEVKWSPVYAD